MGQNGCSATETWNIGLDGCTTMESWTMGPERSSTMESGIWDCTDAVPWSLDNITRRMQYHILAPDECCTRGNTELCDQMEAEPWKHVLWHRTHKVSGYLDYMTRRMEYYRGMHYGTGQMQYHGAWTIGPDGFSIMGSGQRDWTHAVPWNLVYGPNGWTTVEAWTMGPEGWSTVEPCNCTVSWFKFHGTASFRAHSTGSMALYPSSPIIKVSFYCIRLIPSSLGFMVLHPSGCVVNDQWYHIRPVS